MAAVLFLAVSVGGGAFVSAEYSAAVSDTCDTWDPVDISIDELIALKRRKNAWQASMDDEAALVMSDREVDFILPGTTDYELLATFRGNDVHARVAMPLGDRGCLNVTFDGQAWVDRKAAHFVPDHLGVGEVDLTPLVGGREIVLSSDMVEGWIDPTVLNALNNAEKVWIEDSAVHIRLYDRRKVW